MIFQLSSQVTGISETRLKDFSINNVLFYDPGECDEASNNNSTSICGSTVEERVWTILRRTLDPAHSAAVFGNIAYEGSFQPVKWEYRKAVDTNTCKFANGVTWDAIYRGDYDNKFGVGSFQITSGLSKYLKYINDNEPDLLKYFKDPSYTCYAADELVDKIGQSEVDKLLNIEIDYFINKWIPEQKGNSTLDEFLGKKDISEAAKYWAQYIEVCNDCGYESDTQLQPRANAAKGYYDQYKDFNCSSTSTSSGSSSSGNTCAKLGELRTKMWNEASQEDKNSFMYTVSKENHTIAGVEGYMNQIISKHGSDGTLHDWLNDQCYKFRGKRSCIDNSYTIAAEEQSWIDEALAGSNNIKFAIGNATGGSDVGAGKIVCVWDGTKCRDDVDYTAQDGKGKCNVYSPNSSYGECWGLEGEDKWAEEMSKNCGSSDKINPCSGATDASLSSGGFSSAEDAQVVIDNYKKTNLDGYSFRMPSTGDLHDNCVAFTVWWINYYTNITYKVGTYGDGKDVVDYFYNNNISKYPDLKKSNTPSVYSIASWDESVDNILMSSSGHTGVIVGINESEDKIIIAEAAWNNHNYTKVTEHRLSAFKGKGKYINLNKYLKSNAGI